MLRPRVVLAEDHRAVAAELRALLATEFEVCDVVHDGRALVAAVDAAAPDVIVSDIAMPEMGGLAAAREILAAHPASRIIFVTVREDSEVIRHALGSGALGFVVKCDAGEELIVAVRAAIQGARYLSTHARVAIDTSSYPLA